MTFDRIAAALKVAPDQISEDAILKAIGDMLWIVNVQTKLLESTGQLLRVLADERVRIRSLLGVTTDVGESVLRNKLEEFGATIAGISARARARGETGV